MRIALGVGLRGALAEGYGWTRLQADVLAGLTVGIVALPLSMALAIASGVPPQHGLYTAIVAGGLTALLGGARTNVTGPTAAFVVLLVPVSARYGPGGLAIASLMGGGILVTLGVTRLGRLIRYIPYPVTTGFTAGIAVVIALLQLENLLGLSGAPPSHGVFELLQGLAAALPTTRWQDLLVGLATLAVLLLWPRVGRRVPAPLVALAGGAALAAGLSWAMDGFEVATLGSRFTYTSGGELLHGIPRLPPLPGLPWNLPGADGAPVGLSMELLGDLMGPATAIAVLAAIESLLCAVVADGMSGTRHDPDAELVALGI